MKVLLATLHDGLLRNFESVVRDLSARGHEVVLASEEGETLGGDRLAASLVSLAGVRRESIPPASSEAAIDLGQRLRLTGDYLRFRSRAYEEFPKLRERLDQHLPQLVHDLRVANVPGARAALGALEQALPASPGLTAWLEAQRPDVVLLASLTHYRSLQPDLLRASIALRIPSIAGIYSWDHLSSKSRIIDVPDAIFVWNETQRREAEALHGLPGDRVVVTGAQCYDQWFTRRPTRDRETFCRDVGLDPSKPFLLYVCSALTPSPDEPAFVIEWARAVRNHSREALRDAGLLVRPHPERLHEWNGYRLDMPNAVLRGAPVVDAEAKAEYFDAMAHASAVVGLVTSALLEAAVIGRPVLTLTLPKFAPHQWGMQHFRYLLEVEGGLPIVATALDAHLDQLAATLGGDRGWEANQRRFLASFVRPRGIDAEATTIFVDELLRVAGSPSRARRGPASVLARLAAPLALKLAAKPGVRLRLMDEAERRNQERLEWERTNRRSKEQVKDARYREKESARAERAGAERARRLEKEAAKAARIAAKARDRRRSRWRRAGARLAQLVGGHRR